MALLVPHHIEASGLMAQLPAFKWDDEPFECEFEVPRLNNDISPLFSRAVLAFAAATAEWVVWPLSHGKDPVFTDFIEACWAAVVDRRYLRHTSRGVGYRVEKFYKLPADAGKAEDLWQPGETLDRLRGPQFVALYLLERVADLTVPNDNGSMEAVNLSNLVEQISKKSTGFKIWRRKVLARLQEHHGMEMDSGEWLGAPVPREALDLSFPYDPSAGPDLIRAFLKGLDPSTNRFLTPAAEMVQLGFVGTPYEF